MSGKARENYRKKPCTFLVKYEKYLTERVLPSFRVCLKNDRKSLNDAFGREFLSDAKISHQLTERPCIAQLHSRERGAAFPDVRRLTRDSWVSVVSLEIPGIVVSLEIPVFRIFLVKYSGKILKIGFSDSRDQNKITILVRLARTRVSQVKRRRPASTW